MYHGLIGPLVHDPYHAVPEQALPQVKPGTDPRTRPYHRGEEGVVRRPPPKGGRVYHALPLEPDLNHKKETTMAKPTTTFHEHLLASTHRDDALGDLAKKYKYATEQRHHRRVRDHHELHGILAREGADLELHDAVDALHHDHDRDCCCTYRGGTEVQDGNSFFRDRAAWIEPDLSGVIVHKHRLGYEIALRIDGTYQDEEEARAMASYFRSYIRALRIPQREDRS